MRLVLSPETEPALALAARAVLLAANRWPQQAIVQVCGVAPREARVRIDRFFADGA